MGMPWSLGGKQNEQGALQNSTTPCFISAWKNIHIFKKSPPPIHKLATQTHPTRYCGFINFLLLTATRSVAQVFCRSWTWTSDGIRTVQESRPHQDSSMAGALCV